MGDARPFAGATRSQRAMPPLNRTARLCRGPATPNEFATPDGCIAPTLGSLRPRVGRGDTFTMGDASLVREAPPPPRPRHPGLMRPGPPRAAPLRLARCARALAEAIRLQWAMPPLNGSAHLGRGPAIPV